MRTLTLAALALAISACATTPEEPEIVEVVIDPTPTCVPVATLQAVQIPEETESYEVITQIDNPPYEPIEEKQTLTRVTVPAYTAYRDAAGNAVSFASICEDVPPPPMGAKVGVDTLPADTRPPLITDDRQPRMDATPVMQGGARDLTRG